MGYGPFVRKSGEPINNGMLSFDVGAVKGVRHRSLDCLPGKWDMHR